MTMTQSNLRISKRKLAHPIKAPDSLGYANLEEEKRARRPRYFDMSRLGSGASVWSCEKTLENEQPFTSMKRITSISKADWLAHVPLVNDRHGRSRILTGLTYPSRAEPFLQRGSGVKLLNTVTVPTTTLHPPPDTPSSRPPQNTIRSMPPAYIPAGRRGVSASASTNMPASMRRSASVTSTTSHSGRRASAAPLQRTNSSDTLNVPLQRRHSTRAPSPIPLPHFLVESPASPDHADEDHVEEETEEGEEADEYQPRKKVTRILPSDGTAIKVLQRRKPRAKSDNKKNLSIASIPTAPHGLIAGASGSEYESDVSAMSTKSRGRPRKRRLITETPEPSPVSSSFPLQEATDTHVEAALLPSIIREEELDSDALPLKKLRTLPPPLPMTLANPAHLSAVPRLHSPLSQTFLGNQEGGQGNTGTTQGGERPLSMGGKVPLDTPGLELQILAV